MGRLTMKLTQTASKIATTRNEYGDDVWGAAEADIPCLYRDISTLSRRNSNREEVEIDGLLWFDADRTVNKADIYLIGTEYFRVEKVIIARDRLRSNTIQFIKCEVTKQRQVS